MEKMENVGAQLSELGLNTYESRVYFTLITEGISTAKNISDTTGIPYGKVYEIVDSLAKKGFVIMLPTKPIKVQATSPKEAMINIKKDHYRQFKKVENLVEKELEPLFTKTKQFADPRAIFWVLIGRATINRRIEDIIGKAQNNIHIFVSENGLKRLRLFKNILKKLRDSGVKIKIAGTINKNNVEYVKDIGFCDIKHSNGSYNSFFSVDGRECIVFEPTPDDDNLIYGRDLGLWVQSPSFTRFMENFFNANFDKAKDLEHRVKEIKMNGCVKNAN